VPESLAPQLRRRLEQGLETLEASLAPAAVDDLLRYLGQLQRWNRAFNLTAIREPLAMVDRHLLDSLSILSLVRGPRVLDMGTGAGLPGIPLALARRDWQVDLLDSNGKKTRFLVQQKAELGLAGTVLHCRVEEHRPSRGYDTVVSRALAPLEQLARWAQPLLAPGGQLVAMKSARLGEELSALPKQFKVDACVDLVVPGVDGVRNAAVLSVADLNEE